jgi:hypothetical protein
MAYSGLLDVHRDASDTCTHLVCIPWWPLIEDGMDSDDYLEQHRPIGWFALVETSEPCVSRSGMGCSVVHM